MFYTQHVKVLDLKSRVWRHLEKGGRVLHPAPEGAEGAVCQTEDAEGAVEDAEGAVCQTEDAEGAVCQTYLKSRFLAPFGENEFKKKKRGGEGVMICDLQRVLEEILVVLRCETNIDTYIYGVAGLCVRVVGGVAAAQSNIHTDGTEHLETEALITTRGIRSLATSPHVRSGFAQAR